jgi:hypothetical protein
MDPKRGPNSPPSLFLKLHWWLVDLQLITDLERTSVFQDWKFERSNLFLVEIFMVASFSLWVFETHQ